MLHCLGRRDPEIPVAVADGRGAARGRRNTNACETVHAVETCAKRRWEGTCSTSRVFSDRVGGQRVRLRAKTWPCLG